MSETTEIIAQITRDHACRAILIGLDPETPGPNVQAWISAHCHLSRAGAKQSLLRANHFPPWKGGLPLIPNIVFSHLDSDLPLMPLVAGNYLRNPKSNCGPGWIACFLTARLGRVPGGSFELSAIHH